MIINSTKGTIIAEQHKVSKSLISKITGLIKYRLMEEEGLLMPSVFQIHTFFMKYAIDVIFLDRNFTVAALYQNLQPWKLSNLHLKSKYVLELNVGAIQKSLTSIGDKIAICTN